MRKTIISIIVVLMSIATFGQGAVAQGYVPGQTSEAYAYTHGGYVGQAIVKVLPNGDLDVEIDEAFLPHILALVDMKSSDWTEANTASYVSHGNKVHVAKYIEYDGKVFVGTTVGKSLTYVEADDSGEPAGAQDLELTILRNQATMAAYYKNIRNGSFKIFTKFKGKATPITKTKYGGVTKETSPKYWNFGQTWKGNINAIEDFIEENGAAFQLSEMMRAEEKNKDGKKLWSVADAVTGATNSDFKDYFGLVQAAIGRLKME